MATFLAGQTITAALVEALVSAWTDYTPVWSTGATQPVIGNGTLTGRYKQIGKVVHYEIGMLAGSTTTFGTGQWAFSLPVTAAQLGSPLNEKLLGEFEAWDNSASGRYLGSVVTTNGSEIAGFLMPSAGTGSGPITGASGTVPFTFATSDRIVFSGSYQAA